MKTKSLQKIGWFASTSMVVVSVLFILLLLNIGFHFYFKRIGVMTAPQEEVLLIEQKYPDIHNKQRKMGVAEPEKLLRESYSAGMIYEPFTGFRETPRQGKWVNVDPVGFRWNANKNPWPPDPSYKNIFFFGGSTTFGYGIMDSQTIPSFLEEILSKNKKVRVYNFGRSHYYSTQERILFEQLLMKGYKPYAAVFLDGLNDFTHTNEELFQEDQMTKFWNREMKPLCEPYINTQVAGIPLVRLALSLKKRIFKNTDETAKNIYGSEVQNNPAAIEMILNRYAWNKTAIESIAKENGVKVQFFWQPVPLYHYNLEYHEYKEHGFGTAALCRHGYPVAEAWWKKGKFGKNFTWIADLAQDWKETVYVDAVHYSAAFNQTIAYKIALQD